VSIRIDKEKLVKALAIVEDFKTALMETLAPIRESTTLAFEGVLSPSEVRELDPVHSPSKHSALVLTVRAIYGDSPLAGVRARWLYSPDGYHFDSVEDAEDEGNFIDVSHGPLVGRQKTAVVPFLTEYVKVQIVNLDTQNFVTVRVWTTLLR